MAFSRRLEDAYLEAKQEQQELRGSSFLQDPIASASSSVNVEAPSTSYDDIAELIRGLGHSPRPIVGSSSAARVLSVSSCDRDYAAACPENWTK